MLQFAQLLRRGVIEVSGEDRVGFLQGLVSNDVTQAAPGRAIWAALLTPQGKWLADFFVLAAEDALLLDCEHDQTGDLMRRLSRFRLRARVTVNDASHRLHVHAAWSGDPPPHPGWIAAPDPRLPGAGWRVLAAEPIEPDAGFAAWDRHRLALGLPDGSRDLEAEKTVLIEAGFDELHGVSWTKGCYMGQELTARTKFPGDWSSDASYPFRSTAICRLPAPRSCGTATKLAKCGRGRITRAWPCCGWTR